MPDTFPVHSGLEALSDGFFILDAHFRVVYWNGAADRLLHVSRDRVLGRDLAEGIPEIADSFLGRRIPEVMARREAEEFVMPHLPGCCTGHFFVRVAPVEEGGVAVHIRDATDETKLAERYAQLLESIRDGFVAVDPDGTIVYLNHVAERILRLRRGAGLGSSVWSLIPKRPCDIEDALRGTLEDGQPRHLRRIRPEVPVLRDHFFDIWVHPLSGGGISVLFQDVTRRVQREKDLARYAAEAEEANHAKSRFFTAISHELRTPLNAIVGYTHLLSTETYGGLPAAAARAATRASVCAEHLSNLVDDLLLMTAAEIDRLPVAASGLTLGAFLPNALEPIRQQAEAKGLGFSVQVAADTPVLETDPDRLRQLLHALLSNAVKFTHRGTVQLAVGRADDPALAIAERFAPPGSGSRPFGVRLLVRDSGQGIPPEARERVFEAFEQLGDPARSASVERGPGLGLTVARRLATLLGGRLFLAETGESGSVFCLDLPLSAER